MKIKYLIAILCTGFIFQSIISSVDVYAMPKIPASEAQNLPEKDEPGSSSGPSRTERLIHSAIDMVVDTITSRDVILGGISGGPIGALAGAIDHLTKD